MSKRAKKEEAFLSDSLIQELRGLKQYGEPELIRRLKDAVLEHHEGSLKGRHFAPHCDQAVLHQPGKCEYCDRYPEWQLARQLWRINFTDEHDPSKLECPAEARRTSNTINRWGGNRAKNNNPTYIFDLSDANMAYLKGLDDGAKERPFDQEWLKTTYDALVEQGTEWAYRMGYADGKPVKE